MNRLDWKLRLLRKLFNRKPHMPLPGRAFVVTAWPRYYYDWMEEQRENRRQGRPWHNPHTAVWVASSQDIRGHVIRPGDMVIWRGPTPLEAKEIQAHIYLSTQFGATA